MTQEERLDYLIRGLLAEHPPECFAPAEPASTKEKWRQFRSLVNIRPPRPAGADWLAVQDACLREDIARRGITDAADITPLEGSLCLWRGDVTTLRADAIVNAANAQLLGCFAPCHLCIDNAIHTFAGVQLRLACAQIMERQGFDEPCGRAQVTPAFNLPARFVLHTVGPLVRGAPTTADDRRLASCYRSCLELAEKNGVQSLAFCCISTGVFHFPNERAAYIAVGTVRDYLRRHSTAMKVIFNVFTDIDESLYRSLLGAL